VGVSRLADVQFMVRVYPRPTAELILRFEADLQPEALTVLALQRSPVDLPFSDIQMEQIVLPLAERELLASRVMRDIDGTVARRIEERAQRAERALSKLPGNHGRPRRRIRRKRGW